MKLGRLWGWAFLGEEATVIDCGELWRNGEKEMGSYKETRTEGPECEYITSSGCNLSVLLLLEAAAIPHPMIMLNSVCQDRGRRVGERVMAEVAE